MDLLLLMKEIIMKEVIVKSTNIMIKNTKSNKCLNIARHFNYGWEKVFSSVFRSDIKYRKNEIYTSPEWITMEELSVLLSENIKRK